MYIIITVYNLSLQIIDITVFTTYAYILKNVQFSGKGLHAPHTNTLRKFVEQIIRCI